MTGRKPSAAWIRRLASLSTQDLIGLFEKTSIHEVEARSDLESAKAAKYFWQRSYVVRELRHRPSDMRSALFNLYGHVHPQVRLHVAYSTFALDPERARSIIEDVANSRLEPWAFDAGMTLCLLKEKMTQLPLDTDPLEFTGVEKPRPPRP